MTTRFGESPIDPDEVAKIMGYKPTNEELDVDEKEDGIEEDEVIEE